MTPSPKNVLIAATRWLELREIHLTSKSGKEKAWTYAARPDHRGAVNVIALTQGPDSTIVLARQLRAPVGRPVIEFPAGLIDAGESPEQAAHRELQEETGWRGKTLRVGPPTYPSPGLTDEAIYFVEVQLQERGDATPEEDEAIEVLEWPLNELRARLEAAAAKGDGIDSKLWNFALATRV